MGLLLQHRLAVAIVAVALAATAGVFLFARPQYRPPRCDNCKQLHFDAPRPYHGWQWRDATPGFHFGEFHDEWRVMSRVGPADLPRNAGVLAALTDRPHGTEVLWHDGRCVGITFEDGARQRLCNVRTPIVLLAHAEPQVRPGWWNMFVIGIARGDVARITVDGNPVFDAKTPPWWGAWDGSIGEARQWDAVVKAYGRQGLLATAHVTFDAPGEKLYCASALRGVCGMSAHRRS